MTVRQRCIAVIHSAATGSKQARTLLTPIGATLFTAFAALMVGTALVVDDLLGLPGILPTSIRWKNTGAS